MFWLAHGPVTRHREAFLPSLDVRQARKRHRAKEFSQPELVTKKERQFSLWREKLLACDKEVFKWLRGQSGAPVYNLYWNDSPVSMPPLEGIQCLKDFWGSVWNRECPDFETIFTALNDAIADVRRPTLVWEALFAEELAKASRALAGTSEGIDGWRGDDLRSGLAKTPRTFFSRFGCQVSGPWTWFSASDVSVRIFCCLPIVGLLVTARHFNTLFGSCGEGTFTASGLRAPESTAIWLEMSLTVRLVVRLLALKRHSLVITLLCLWVLRFRCAGNGFVAKSTEHRLQFSYALSALGADLQHVVWSCSQR